MKDLKIYIMLAMGVFMASCSQDDKAVDDLFSTVERGAILRTIAVPSPTFDFFDTSSVFTITLEEQDAENGALFSGIDIYASHVVAATGDSSAEALVTTVSASTFSTGPFGLPRGNVSVSLAEVLGALGLQAGDYESADQFVFRLVLKLTDGRSFTSTDATGTISGGSFFSAPFSYSAQFFCPLTDTSLFDGNYVVVVDAWADYDPGQLVPVVPDATDPLSFRILSTNNPFIGNPGTSYMLVTVNPVDGKVTVSSNECFDYGPGFCLDVSGKGSVGTCTGDINITIDFGGFTNNNFRLVKQ